MIFSQNAYLKRILGCFDKVISECNVQFDGVSIDHDEIDLFKTLINGKDRINEELNQLD